MWRTTEIRVFVDPGRDEWMGDLHDERGGAPQKEKGFAVDPPGDGVDWQEPNVAHTTSVLLRSFGFAFAGVAYMLRTQRNARIEIAVAVAVIVLAVWLAMTPLEWAMLALTITLVIALEWINTSLELLVTLASPERHQLAKAAKDVAAASVLVGALGSVAIGVALLGPRLVARLLGP